MLENNDVNLYAMSFERFSMWTVNSLKKFLHIYEKSTEGGIDDLVARYKFLLYDLFLFLFKYLTASLKTCIIYKS